MSAASCNSSGASSEFNQTPMSLRACNDSRCASHTDKGTITWPGGTSTASGAFSGFGIRVHSLSTMAPSLTSFGIDALLKRLVAETLIRSEERRVGKEGHYVR